MPPGLQASCFYRRDNEGKWQNDEALFDNIISIIKEARFACLGILETQTILDDPVPRDIVDALTMQVFGNDIETQEVLGRSIMFFGNDTTADEPPDVFQKLYADILAPDPWPRGLRLDLNQRHFDRLESHIIQDAAEKNETLKEWLDVEEHEWAFYDSDEEAERREGQTSSDIDAEERLDRWESSFDEVLDAPNPDHESMKTNLNDKLGLIRENIIVFRCMHRNEQAEWSVSSMACILATMRTGNVCSLYKSFFDRHTRVRKVLVVAGKTTTDELVGLCCGIIVHEVSHSKSSVNSRFSLLAWPHHKGAILTSKQV